MHALTKCVLCMKLCFAQKKYDMQIRREKQIYFEESNI